MTTSPYTSRRRHPSTYTPAEDLMLLQAQKVQATRRLRALRQKAHELAEEIEAMERQLVDIDRAENSIFQRPVSDL